MHYITIPEQELLNEETYERIVTKETKLQLEHSLISVHKWEKKWKKSFLKTFDRNNVENITREELLSYVECMTITPNVNPDVYYLLTQDDIESIFKYIDDPMSATVINNRDPSANGFGKKRVITAEVIYAWMILQGIPKEFEKWHFNTLMTLIRVVSIEGNPKRKKESKAEAMARHRATNARRRGKL